MEKLFAPNVGMATLALKRRLSRRPPQKASEHVKGLIR